MRTRIAAAAISAAALIALTACSSSSSHHQTTVTPADASASAADNQDPAAADKTALTKSIRDYTAELFDGNPDGYRLMSARCKRQMSKDEWTALAKQGHHNYGSQQATDIHIDELSGNLARVTYGAGHIPAMDRKGQPWTREGGTWRWDGCQATS